MWKWLFIFVAVVVLGLALLVANVGQVGESRIEAWVGSQLKTIVNQGDKFKLEFASIDYQAPNRAVLKGLRLSLSEDEGMPAPLVEIDRATIVLAKVPRWGEPIVLRSVSLDSPTVHIESFIAAAKRDDDDDAPTTRPVLSSILTLERVEIANGAITYDDGKGSPLSWTQLDARLDLESTQDHWHKAAIAIDEPLMKARIAAELDLDTAVARNIAIQTVLNLNDPAAAQFLTPPLQRMISTYQIRGLAELRVNGLVDTKQKDRTSVDASLQLTQGNVTVGAYHLPVDRAVATAQVRGTTLTVDNVETELLGGSVRGSAELNWGDANTPVRAQAVATGLKLHELLDAAERSQPTSLAGDLSADLRLSSTLADLRGLVRRDRTDVEWGSGYLRINDGRLVRIPVLAQLMNVTRNVTGFFTGNKEINRDSFEAQFRFVDRTAHIGDMLYSGDALALRGKGTITAPGDLDLVVNAGPLERLQKALGPLGSLWGRITDKIMSYSVKGTLKEPVVRPMLGSG